MLLLGLRPVLGLGTRPRLHRAAARVASLPRLHRGAATARGSLGVALEHFYADGEPPPPPPFVFDVEAPFPPSGDQPEAIDTLVERLQGGSRFQVLRGATGTGKTFVMAHTIARLGKPALVLCHNKTLAAQLARELKSYLPSAAVELFVSYYNYYRPEAYMVAADKYLSKVSSVNAELDAMRHRATRALFERRDVVIVASVSCIYGLGLPRNYLEQSFDVTRGMNLPGGVEAFTDALRDILYAQKPPPREDTVSGGFFLGDGSGGESSFERGCYALLPRPRFTDVLVWPPYEELPLRFRLGDGRVQRIDRADRADGDVIGSDGESNHILAELHEDAAAGSYHAYDADEDFDNLKDVRVYPARHHVTPRDVLLAGCERIEREMNRCVKTFMAQGKVLEAQRLRERVEADLVMLRETGTCHGVENYSALFAGRSTGEPPETLLDYFNLQVDDGGSDGAMSHKSGDWLLIADESHASLPQLRAMYEGDRRRKQSLVSHGFRLPSALDNRPLSAPEFWDRVTQGIFVSATPGGFELDLAAEHSDGPPAHFEGQEMLSPGGNVVEMNIRPTHVLDPVIEVLPTEGQLEVLAAEVRACAAAGGRALVVALTKRDAEDLSDFLSDEEGVRSDYLHCDLGTTERSEVLRRLQVGDLDVVVGVNLLREGLDLPEVRLVAILDADKEGFLRNDRSLIQSVGRAARNAEGRAIFFADRVSAAMSRCMRETQRRRERQQAYNEATGCQPRSTTGREIKSVFDIAREETSLEEIYSSVAWTRQGAKGAEEEDAEEEATAAATSEAAAAAAVAAAPEASALDAEEDDGRVGSKNTNPVLDAVMRLSHVEGLREEARQMPLGPGIYIWKTADGDIVYVGKAKNLRRRVLSYFRHGRAGAGGGAATARVRGMLEKSRRIEYEETASEHAALLLEAAYIKEYEPVYNIRLKDDAFFPYLVVDLARSPPEFRVTTNGGDAAAAATATDAAPPVRYFGPFASHTELRDVRSALTELFALNTRRVRVKYGNEAPEAYARDLVRCAHILGGGADEVRAELEAEGDGALPPERAALLDRVATFVDARRDMDFLGGGAKGEPPTDVVAVAVQLRPEPDGGGAAAFLAVAILQISGGSVGARFLYDHALDVYDADDVNEAVFQTLEKHYLRLHARQLPARVFTSRPLPAEQRGSLQSLFRARHKTNEPEAGSAAAVTQTRVLLKPPRDVALRSGLDLAEDIAKQEAFKRAGVLDAGETALHDVRDMLALPAVPRYIEAFDISHLDGQDTVASKVVFLDGKPAKALYRTYNIGSLADGEIDDFKSMAEVLERSFERHLGELRGGDESPAAAGAKRRPSFPDLVLIDGGKGQLSAAVKGLQRARGAPPEEAAAAEDAAAWMERTGTTFVSLAKREEEVFRVGATEAVPDLDKDSPGMRLLRAVRDESHRFAIQANRRRRTKKLKKR